MSETHEAAERRSFAAKQARIGCACTRVEHLNILRLIHHWLSDAGHFSKKSLSVFAFTTSPLLSQLSLLTVTYLRIVLGIVFWLCRHERKKGEYMGVLV